MIDRRDLIVSGLSVGAAALAEGLRPRKKLKLLNGATIDKVLPLNFDRWASVTSPELVSPELAGKLAASLYSEIVERTYHDSATGAGVMLLAAYGDTQSDLLQLHRPEACYPAVGFTIASTRAASIQAAPGVMIPGRKVVAVAEGRNENIAYWTRLGEQIPQSSGGQKMARFQNSLHGYVSDGILMRCSVIGESEPSFAILDHFVPSMLRAVAAVNRPALIGTRLSQQMSASV